MTTRDGDRPTTTTAHLDGKPRRLVLTASGEYEWRPYPRCARPLWQQVDFGPIRPADARLLARGLTPWR
jgi:hypothetical protein